MTTLRRVRWAGVLLVGMTMACTAAAPPHQLIERNDHGALVTWYEQEAAGLRGKVEEMRQMLNMYAKPSFLPAPKESTVQLIAHCQLFIEYYTKAAEEAEGLAKLHRDLGKAAP